ncbi:MAG: T3SS effector HopA1 family protein [Spirosomataceae bacterium]
MSDIISYNTDSKKSIKSIVEKLDTRTFTKSINENIIDCKEVVYEYYSLKYAIVLASEHETDSKIFNQNEIEENKEALGLIDYFEYDKYWLSTIKKEHKEDKEFRENQLIIKKVARTERAYPGEFLIKNKSELVESRYILDAISITKIKSKDDIYFRGKTYIGELDDIIRFYLNIKSSEKVKLIADTIIKYFNEFEIPFELKYYTSEKDFNRADTCVLYVKGSYFTTALFILGVLYVKFKDSFRSDLPLFVKKIADGIGFAESPQNPSISFGEKRAYLIAEAYILNLNSQNKLACILDFIKNKGYDLDNFQINPKSYRHYKLNIFDKGKLQNIETFGKFKNYPKIYQTWFNKIIAFSKYKLKKEYIQSAYKIAKILCNEAIWIDDKNCKWISGYIDKNDKKLKYKLIDDTFDDGSLGIALFLSRIYFYFDNVLILETILGAINSLLERVTNKNHTTDLSELLLQKFALVQIYRILRNQKIDIDTTKNIEFAYQEVQNQIDQIQQNSQLSLNRVNTGTDTDKIYKTLFNVNVSPKDYTEVIRILKEFDRNDDIQRPVFGQFDDSIEKLYEIGDYLSFIIQSGRSFTNIHTNERQDVFCPDITNGYTAVGHFFLRLYDPYRIWSIPKYL